jgi:hypothetical protein
VGTRGASFPQSGHLPLGIVLFPLPPFLSLIQILYHKLWGKSNLRSGENLEGKKE